MTELLRARTVTAGYKVRGGDNRKVLDRISISARASEVICIIGPSGIGKSTLLSILAGRHVNAVTQSAKEVAVRGRVAWQPQETPLVRVRSVLENVAIGARAHSIAEPKRVASAMLDLVRLGTRATALPHELSVGMRQRVALARTLASQPTVALLDEPLSALDVESRQYIARRLKEYARTASAAIVMVTHTIEEAIDFGSRIYVLQGYPARVVCVCSRSAETKPAREENPDAEVIVSADRADLFARIVDMLGKEPQEEGDA